MSKTAHHTFQNINCNESRIDPINVVVVTPVIIFKQFGFSQTEKERNTLFNTLITPMFAFKTAENVCTRIIVAVEVFN